MKFTELCQAINEDFLREWGENRGDYRGVLMLQKKAIIGYEAEVAYFMEKIRERVSYYHAEETVYPAWYPSLEEAIYHENWGLAGIAQWFSEPYLESSSCKVIGERIYFLTGGHMEKMPQRLSAERREQLVRAFLLLAPDERMDRETYELYLLDGTRVTIFRGSMVKPGEDVMVFRRYTVPRYTFEEQAARGTIPKEAIPLFQSMVEGGFNVAFTGPLRSAKTTFLSTWQSYEDPLLEGVMVETDPEIPLHKLMPEAPIVQVLADGEKLETVSKSLLRSDADYIVLAEARDGRALDLAIRMAGKGTRRMKMTFHLREPKDFPFDAAWEICKTEKVTPEEAARKVATSFDYVFHFAQMRDKSRKRLKGIYQMSYERESKQIVMKPICLYRPADDSWVFSSCFDEEKSRIAEEECPGSAAKIQKQLKQLAERFPMEEC